MSTTKGIRKRYTVKVTATRPDEQRIYLRDFYSTNPEKYLETYRKRLNRIGWNSVEFSNLTER